MIEWLLGSRVEEVVGHVSDNADLSRDGAAHVMAEAAVGAGVYLAQYRNGPPAITDMPARLAEEEAELATAGWGPWLAMTMPRHAGDQSAGVLRTQRADLRSTDRPNLEPGQQAGNNLGSRQSARRGSKAPMARRRRRWPAAAGLLVVLALALGALAVWQLGDQREVASDGLESISADPVSTTSASTNTTSATTATTQLTESPATTTTVDPTSIPEVVNYSVSLGDPQNRSEAGGTLDLQIDTIAGEICYAFDVAGLQTPYAAHIHVGPSGENGGITVDFGTELSDSSADCVPSEPADLAAAITSSNQRYVELHDPTGAFSIRGQLTDPEPGETDRPAEVDISDGAYIAVSGGSIVLRGDVPDQRTLEEFVASQPDGDGAITVVNELRIVEGAKPPSGLVVIEGSILFALNSAELADADILMLTDVAEILRARPAWSVNLVGHTDSSGPVLYNFDLSLRRARTVRRALIDLGVAAAAVTIQGDGPISPIAENSTDDGQAQNRRIELLVDAGS